MTTRKTFTPAFKLEIAKLMVDENYLCPLGYTIKQACEASAEQMNSLSGTRLPIACSTQSGTVRIRAILGNSG